ncbi:MAG: hypothetical protein PVI59_04665 [Anaerolineae bacterium]|jgi:hypothetical protein
MIVNTYEMYRVALERMADDLRDAEHRRLVRSVVGYSPGWLQRLRLSLRRPAPTPAGESRSSRPISSPTL